VGDHIKHEIQSLLGEVSDHGVMALRQLLSDRFHFDLTEKHIRDAVVTLAIEHSFDPVCDLIDKAEADWDGVKRLGKAAVTHFNCADTPLNCAFMRKTIIAMVARARVPGIKFDTITVLESPEGMNKSTAWRVLAGDENFSDEAIIGKGSREVQEQLAGVWVHENAELAGMKKADVETVKAYASRTTDIARAAYGHFPIRQKRHSIDVGTTNSAEYLPSQTGNRRFWPMKLLGGIDQELLRRDRLQLIGEAAHYQTAGESITLDESMWGDAGVAQEKRRTKDAWEDVLAVMPAEVEIEFTADSYGNNQKRRIIDVVGVKPDQEERVASSDVLTYVLKIPVGLQNPAHTMRLPTVMKQLGWLRDEEGNKITVNGVQVRGYFRPVEVEVKADPAMKTLF
jgi:predicted P-loop ATPase